MSAESDLLLSKKPYLLTLKGPVTVHYLDGQTLEGEIAAQDDLNIWLTVDDTPHLIPRSQIRHIKGMSGQQIVPEMAQAGAAIAPVIEAEIPAETPPEPEPTANIAQFVEEVEIAPPADDFGGTVVIAPPSASPAPAEEAQTDAPPPADELADTGMTFVLPREAAAAQEAVVETKEHEVTDPAPAVLDVGETELLPHLDMEDDDEDDATFVFGESDDEEISVHLICTTGPHAGEVYQLKPGVTTIGRSSDNSFPISKDKEASRRHAIIVYEASKFVIQDQNSLNGTFVNDQLIKEPRPLANGDVILIGISTLKFQER